MRLKLRYPLKDYIIAFLAMFVAPCDVVSHRLSDQYQRKLTWRERLSNRLHMPICVWCRRYEQQLGVLHDAVHHMAADPDETTAPDEGLSQDARDRIRRALDNPDR